MSELYTTYTVLGVGAVLLALVSRWIRMAPVSEPMVALALGVLVGPALLGLVEVSDNTRDLLLLEGSRFLLALSVMAAALRFPVADLRGVVRTAVILVLVVMPVAAAIGGATALLLGVPLALALLVGACLCPTDPVLAASVVSGKLAEEELPARLRQVLTVESGSNDGLALPLVGLALVPVLAAEHLGDAALVLTGQVLGGVVIGLALGAAAGWGMRTATKDAALERGPELVFTLLLAVAVLGVARLASTDGVLAVFVAGLAYNRTVAEGERGTQQGIDEAANRYVVLPLFLLLGTVLPWADWAEHGLAAVAFVAAVLLLRRLPVVLLLAKPLGLRGRDAGFVGWFGPMGVSALFYLGHSMHKGVTDPALFAAVTLAVAASTVAFGLSGSPGRQLYYRTEAGSDRQTEESRS